MISSSILRSIAILGFLLGLSCGPVCALDPIQAHPQNPYIFKFRGQPTLLRTFAESYSTLVDSKLPYIPYLDVLQRDGMNLTNIWCLGFPPDYPGTPARFLQPWPRSTTAGVALDGLKKWDFSQWNESYFTRLKAIAQAASDRGIVIEFTLFSSFYLDILWELSPFHPLNNVQGYGPGNWNDSLRDVSSNQTLLAVQKAAVRRIVNELNGFDNVYFHIQNEPFWNEPGVKDSQEVAFHNQMLAEIRAEEAGLPNRHLVAHNFPQQLAALSTDFDIINEHYPIPIPGATIAGSEALLANHYSRGMILSLDESDTETELQLRLEAWMFLIGGGAVYDGLDPEGRVYTAEDPSGDNALGNAMREAVRNIGTYMDQLHLVTLRRNLTWVTGGIPVGAKLQASSSPDQQYVAYLHHGQAGSGQFPPLHYDPISTSTHNVSLRVNLEAGDWRAVWTRPFDLAELHTQEFTHTGGNITLEQVTYQADVALRIDRTYAIPSPPSGLGVQSNADGSITLSWNAIQMSGLTGYHVYRSEAPEVPTDTAHRIAVLNVGETGFTDQPEITNATYYYVVTAVDQADNEWPATFETSADSIFPSLKLSFNAMDQLVIEWTTTFSGWFLQESPDLTPASWMDSLLVPAVDGDHYQTVIATTPPRMFFRLMYRPVSPVP